MPTLPNISIITPTLGADRGTWDDKINAAFGLVDAHDHTSGKGVQVPVSGLDINADFAMGGYGVSGLSKISFTAIAAPSTGSKNLFVSSADNELYWRTNAGVNVKLTSGTTLNASLIGGIAGDYASVGAEVAYVDADATYTFKDKQSPKRWARLQSGPVRIVEFNTTESVYVELVAPAALGASYTVTWPTAVPASTAVMQMSAAGVLTASNTLPSLDHVTLQANKDVIISGTGTVKHGTHTLLVNNVVAITTSGSVSTGTDGLGNFSSAILAVSTVAYLPIDGLKAGDRITEVRVRHSGPYAGANVLAVRLRYVDGTTGAPTDTGSDSNTSSPLAITGLAVDVTTQRFFIKLTTIATSGYGVYSAEIDYTRP